MIPNQIDYQVKLGLKAQNDAAEIKIRAQRRLGEILIEIEKAKGTRGQLSGRDSSGGYSLQPLEKSHTYAEMGIEKRDAHYCQTIAKFPEDRFELLIQEAKSNEKEELATASIYRVARKWVKEETKQDPAPISVPAAMLAIGLEVVCKRSRSLT